MVQRRQTAGEPEAEVIGVVRDSRIDTIGEAPQSVILPVRTESRPRHRPRTNVVPPESMVSAGRGPSRTLMELPLSASRPARSREPRVVYAPGWNGAGWVDRCGRAGAGDDRALRRHGLCRGVASVEVAIRMALGASAGSRQAEILAQVFGLLAAGAVIGGAASLGLAPAFQMLLVGVSGFDPVSVRGRGPLLAIVGLAAGIVPAIRASRVLPMRALRRAAGSL